ncbi:MAG: hypothetical protein BKP49_03960 [Treponema sp. CETP13]|nr:MAG: hypothetical protein BKP49_03960 [Treponema sp. CETP13]
MKRRFSLLLIFGMTMAVAFAQSDLQPLAVVSLYKTESINLKQLKKRVDTYQAQAGVASFTVADKKQILSAMIDEKIVVQAAKRDNVIVTDEQADKAFIQAISQQVGQTVTEKQFTDLIKQKTGKSLDAFFLEQVGMDVEHYKDYLQNQLIAQKYVFSLKQDEIKKNSTPTDKEIRSYYDMKKTSFSQNDIVKIFLVILPKGDNVDAARKEINKLYEDFDNKKVSMDELALNSQKGDVDYQAGDMYVNKGATAAKQLGMNEEALLSLFGNDIGYVSQVQETQNNFNFYTVVEKYPAKILGLSDVVRPDQTVTVYEYIRNILTQQKEQAAFQKALESVVTELRTPKSYKMLKSDAELDALLKW